MPVAQSVIFALGTASHASLEFDLQTDGDPLTLAQLIANLEEPRMTTTGVNLVVAFVRHSVRASAPLLFFARNPSPVAHQLLSGGGGWGNDQLDGDAG